jgi:predicted RNA-binding protein
MKQLHQTIDDKVDFVHVCTYAAPFGVVPTELDDVYPLSQNVIAYPFDSETVTYVAGQVANYITKMGYERVILLRDSKVWMGKVAATCRRVCKKKQVPFVTLRERDPWATSTIEHLAAVMQEAVMSL